MRRPSLLFMTAAVSALAAAANGVSAASPDGQDSSAKTRLGSSIELDLNARDSAAAKRKRALDMREQAATAAEARLAAEAEARRKAEAETAGVAGGPTPAETQFDELARIYQAMKPAKAAVVFEQLSMEVQLKVAQRMRERSTAMILASMTPKGAAALSMAMARGTASAPQPPARAKARP